MPDNIIFLISISKHLALPTSDHGVAGSNPAGGEILPEPKQRFIAQSLSCSPFHRREMTEILLKGRKTLTHPSILYLASVAAQAVLSLPGSQTLNTGVFVTRLNFWEIHFQNFTDDSWFKEESAWGLRIS